MVRHRTMTRTEGKIVNARLRREPGSSTKAYARMKANVEAPPSSANRESARNNTDNTKPERDFAERH